MNASDYILMMDIYFEANKIPCIDNFLSDKDCIDNFEELQEQLCAEFLVYGEVQQ